ncbi:hypothetical protein PAECIP111891_00136 [Paenibacillus allorhizoplanae]|uniref:Uncharacterized protein n=1 Tax=Paenibacillus allorhizoplanae TaxID=2905648 RepID=A0ABN8FZG0_9BACL|nr:hypothetical protein PAECIP111891_00136 [Paenibacillus allorhizoplanae]
MLLMTSGKTYRTDVGLTAKIVVLKPQKKRCWVEK